MEAAVPPHEADRLPILGGPVLRFPLGVALATLALFTSCTRDRSEGGVLVGHYGPMSGSEATFGQSTANGIELAVREVNASGGIHGKLVEAEVV